MVSGQIGPLTGLLEAAAAAIGAGAVLGGFTVGTYRLMTGSSWRELEAHVLSDGYAGGGIGAFVVFLDLALLWLAR